MKMLSNLGQQCSGSDRTSYTLTTAKHRKLWVVWLYKTRGVPLSNLNLWRKTAGAGKQIPAFLRIYLFLNDVAQDIWQRENVGWDLWWPGSSQKQRQLVYFEDGINEIGRINYCILKITFPAAHPRFQHLMCCWSNILITQFKTAVVVIFFWWNKLKKNARINFLLKRLNFHIFFIDLYWQKENSVGISVIYIVWYRSYSVF